MIELINVSKEYDGKSVIDDFTYTFNEKGLYVLKGENGSGKSTLLKLICGLLILDEGTINSKGEMFYLPEKLMLPKELKVVDFLKDICDIHQRYIDIDFWLQKYNLKNILIGKLSKGMLQKVGIIMSMIKKYDVILYDEPFEGLDQKSIDAISHEIEKESERCLIILSLHDVPKKIKNKAIIINIGEINNEKYLGD